MRGISLEEIAASTKIGRRLLTALESEQFDLLPGGIFNKSYVRAYAKCIGIDEEAAVAEYLEAAQEPPPDTRVIAQQHASIYAEHPAERLGFPFLPVVILVLVAAAGVGGWKLYQKHHGERQLQAESGDAATSPTTMSPVNTPPSASATREAAPDTHRQQAIAAAPKTLAEGSGPKAQGTRQIETSPSQAAAVNSGSFEVTIRPKGPAWVSVKSDGKYVVRGIIRPPDVKTIRANSEVVVFTGNAGAVEVAFDGKTVPLNGGRNQAQTLVFSPRGPAQGATAP